MDFRLSYHYRRGTQMEITARLRVIDLESCFYNELVERTYTASLGVVKEDHFGDLPIYSYRLSYPQADGSVYTRTFATPYEAERSFYLHQVRPAAKAWARQTVRRYPGQEHRIFLPEYEYVRNRDYLRVVRAVHT